MDFSIIDELYDIYQKEDIVDAEREFEEFYVNHQRYGPKNLIDTINEYIKQQAAFVGNYFVSEKDSSYSEHRLVENMVSYFESVLLPVDDLVVDFVFDGASAEEVKDFDVSLKFRKPHDLFNMDMKFIEDAVRKDHNTYLNELNQIKPLIQYVKKHKVLDKIYKDSSWQDLDFNEVIYSLYDYIQDKSVFNIDEAAWPERDDYLFEKIKANCARKLKGSFDKFRPNLNSSKQMRTDFSKLIFCKNLLKFYETGIMPDNNGRVDFTVDELGHKVLIDDFKSLYSNQFNEEQFRANQSNFICNPDVFLKNFSLAAGRCVTRGDEMFVGYIVSAEDELKYNKTDYLIHIHLKDVNNTCSSYEMQLNIIPRGILDQRLQLIRLDNWKVQSPHKNIAKKLATTTHIHLYNEFDLLRGKTNGEFDIAYNIEDESTEFTKSLKRFLQILDLGEDVSREIYKSTLKSLSFSQNKAAEHGI